MDADYLIWTECSVVDWQLGWNVISETAALATALHGSIVPSEDGQRAYVERIPYGVVLGISRELTPSSERTDFDARPDLARFLGSATGEGDIDRTRLELILAMSFYLNSMERTIRTWSPRLRQRHHGRQHCHLQNLRVQSQDPYICSTIIRRCRST